MTIPDLIQSLRERINQDYAFQRGTESYERRICAEALEAQQAEIGSLSALTDVLGVLGLLADIRAAVGDPTGKLMQDELVAHCTALRTEAMRAEGEYMRAYSAEEKASELAESLREARDALEQLLAEASDLREVYSAAREADGWGAVEEEPCFSSARAAIQKSAALLTPNEKLTGAGFSASR